MGCIMSSGTIFFERQVLSLALLEKELYQLYSNLSEKVDDVSARTLFAYIATDSLKHSTILVAIIEEVNGSKAREQDCDENILYNKKVIKALSKDVEKSEGVSREELISLIDTLVGFESLLFSEYKKAFHLEYSGFSEYERNKDQESEMNIFNLIVGDEERHQRILLAITDLCDKKLSFRSDAPIVKYQSPDSWYVPPRKGGA
jgi:rubrerythrin